MISYEIIRLSRDWGPPHEVYKQPPDWDDPPEIPDNPRSNAQVGQKILLNQELERSGWIHLGIPGITKKKIDFDTKKKHQNHWDFINF